MLLKKKPFPELILLIVIAALAYLPNIGNMTYFKDDWYYIYDGMLAGPKIFHAMFSIDRPARGLFFELYYSLFGPQPLPYHIGAFVWRSLSAIGAFWLFDILWRKERKFVFIAALFFTIYPGYFWWISAIEYQPMMASLALQTFSITFTLKSIQSSQPSVKFICLIASILTGWAYIALVDYAIGMEAFRFFCVYALVARDQTSVNFWKKLYASFRALGWGLLIPIGFTLWRIFIFDNQREATDISLQLSAFFGDPASTGLHWFLQTFNSLLNLAILAWVDQFPRYLFGLRLRAIVFSFITAGLAALFVWIALNVLKQDNEQNGKTILVSREALWIGSIGMTLGIMPIIMANRFINLDSYSHYALPASLAAGVFLAGLIYNLKSKRIQNAVIVIIIVFATLAHYGISVNATTEERAIEKFWWQVSWRVPAIEPDITLVINYPSGNIGDDGNGVMEAANMIYFPQPSLEIPVHYNVSAITLNNSNLRDVLQGNLYWKTQYRSHTANINYGNVLVISQPTPTSCVHVIDGNQPLISVFDPATVTLAAPSSNIGNLILEAEPFTPQDFAFGAEPEHSWCYYYEKADLAIQLGNWAKAAKLGDEAIRLELQPEDLSEWMPFLKAYAISGDDKRVKQTAPKINTEPFLRLQACEMLTNIQEPLNPAIRELIATLYCKTTPE